jgi:NDP-sugar pyrophosphorylase family protein
MVMKGALIAAGQGERLRQAGIELPKPLVRVAGLPLIDHVLGAMANAGIHEVACIFNEEADAVETYCRRHSHGLDLQIVRRTTPSSMESLFALAPFLREGCFLLLTVDAVFGPALLPSFLEAAAKHDDAAGVLAVHRFIDDEKPLFIERNERGRITALGNDAAGSTEITAGIYVFDPKIFREIDAARAAELRALREFLAHLLRAGYRLYGVPVAKTIDVDRPEDIRAAEDFVRGGFAT